MKTLNKSKSLQRVKFDIDTLIFTKQKLTFYRIYSRKPFVSDSENFCSSHVMDDIIVAYISLYKEKPICRIFITSDVVIQHSYYMMNQSNCYIVINFPYHIFKHICYMFAIQNKLKIVGGHHFSRHDYHRNLECYDFVIFFFSSLRKTHVWSKYLRISILDLKFY